MRGCLTKGNDHLYFSIRIFLSSLIVLRKWVALMHGFVDPKWAGYSSVPYLPYLTNSTNVRHCPSIIQKK